MSSSPLLPPMRSASLLLALNTLTVLQAMKAWNDHKEKKGEEVSHSTAKEILCVHTCQTRYNDL